MEESNIEKIIKRIIAEHLGVDVEDVQDEDHLTRDLHMSAADLTDVIEKLSTAGLDTDNINPQKIKTVKNLQESIDFKDEM